MLNSRMKLGDLLLREGLITEIQLQNALIEQKQKPEVPIGEILVEKGIIDEPILVEFLGKQFNLPYINKSKELLVPEQEIVSEEVLPKEYIKQNNVLPLSRKMNVLKVALTNPLDLMLIDNIKVITGYEVAPVIVGKLLLKEAIDSYLQTTTKEHKAKKEIEDETINLDKIMADATEGQVVRIVNLVIMQAVSDGVSDIHIEATEAGMRLRYRIDGELVYVSPPPADLYFAIVSRIKILANMDIAEKRLPQDGSMTMKVEDKNIDMRVSTIPSIYGEKVCIRILDKTRIPLDLDKLGINEVSLGRFKDVLSKPFGMVLVTGPTGSGKTTTLYACLNYLNDVKKNINTIEDPVEYKLEGINQVHVRPDIGLDFSEALRSFLRQDPDIIMVGEIRDNKTADMCVRAALTGHLVLSTLHTNSAVQAIDRLINIGVDPILIISSVELISAQRLVRKLCSACKKEYRPSNAIIKKYNIKDTDKIYKAVGCNKCKKIGYSGRVPLHETLILDEEIKEMIYNKEASFKVEEKACEKGMISLRQCGIAKVKLGITTLEEIMAATI